MLERNPPQRAVSMCQAPRASDPPSILFRIRPSSVYKANGSCETGLLAKVSVKKQSSDSVAVRLESDELSDATVIVSTGLDREKNSHQTPRVPLRCNLQGGSQGGGRR